MAKGTLRFDIRRPLAKFNGNKDAKYCWLLFGRLKEIADGHKTTKIDTWVCAKAHQKLDFGRPLATIRQAQEAYQRQYKY